jgi:hypothetical protein
MTDHLSKRAQLLAEVLRHINDGNYEKSGDAWSFGAGGEEFPLVKIKTKPSS